MRPTYLRGIVTHTAWHRFLLFLPVEHKHDYDSSYIYFIGVTWCNIMAKSQGTVCDCESALQRVTQTTVRRTFVQLKQSKHPSIHTFSCTQGSHDESTQGINIERQTSTLAITFTPKDFRVTTKHVLHVLRWLEDVGVPWRNQRM